MSIRTQSSERSLGRRPAAVKQVMRGAWQGALLGTAAWLAYGVVESSLIEFFPRLQSLGEPPVFPPVISVLALLLAGYALVGALLGAAWGTFLVFLLRLVGWPRGDRHSRLLKVGTILTVVMTYAAFFALNYGFRKMSAVVLAACLGLCIGLACWALGQRWSTKLAPLANAWAVAALVIGMAWLLSEAVDSTTGKLAVVLAYPAGVYAISALTHKLTQRLRRERENGGHQALTAALAALLIVVGTAAAYRPDPPIDVRAAASPAKRGHPSIVLIILDTVRSDHMSLYGYDLPTTPYLEAFAREATVYTGAVAPSPFTLPSHASMFTGRYTRSHGATWNPRWAGWASGEPIALPLAKEFPTLPELLESRGYRTLAIVANFAFLNRRFELARGFHYYDDRAAHRVKYPVPKIFFRQLVLEIVRHRKPELVFRDSRPAEEINQEVLDLLADLNPGEPFFLFVNYMDAHAPYLPPPPYDRLSPGKSDAFSWSDHGRIFRSVMAHGDPLPRAVSDHMVSQYDGAIAYMDDQIGLLIEELKRDGIYDESLIIITSDHGETFGRRGLLGHSSSTYEDQIHVPLIIKFPGVNQGSVVHEPASLVDILPTVLDLLGKKAPAGLQGRSLLAPDTGSSLRVVVSESYPHPEHSAWHPRHARIQRSLYQRSFKLIRSSRSENVELYDLEVDPEERIDFGVDRPDDVATLERLLDAWLESTPDLVTNSPTGADQPQVDEQTLERLRALGYIQ